LRYRDTRIHGAKRVCVFRVADVGDYTLVENARPRERRAIVDADVVIAAAEMIFQKEIAEKRHKSRRYIVPAQLSAYFRTRQMLPETDERHRDCAIALLKSGMYLSIVISAVLF